MTDEEDTRQTPAEAAGTGAGAGGLAASIGARNLWIIILTMPAVFLVVVAIIIAIFGKPGKGAAEDAAVVEASAPAASATMDNTAPIAINAGETIKSVTLDGDRLAAIISGPDGDYVVIYDVVKGEEISRIAFRRD